MAEKLLEVRNLSKKFDGATVLDGVSLTVEQGEVVVIVGPSGCGKSTLLRCINGLERIDSGEILLRGEVISGQTKNLHRIRQRIGMVFQSYDLFPHMNVMENLLLGPTKALGRSRDAVIPEAEAALKRVGLLEKRDALPRQLSGGQKQRVAIVRALLMHPEMLLLDEITAALDPEMVREVLGVVSPDDALITDVAELRGKTLIVSKGTTAETYFTENEPEVELLKFDTYTEAYNALLDGRGDALSTDNTEVLAWALENPGFSVGVDTLGSLDAIAPAVQKGNESLLAWINEEIVALGAEKFFHADYDATLKDVYGEAANADSLVVEGGVIE